MAAHFSWFLWLQSLSLQAVCHSLGRLVQLLFPCIRSTSSLLLSFLSWSFYSFGSHLRLTTNQIPPISTENCYSIIKSCLTLCNSMDCSTPGSSILHCLLEFAQLMSIESVMLLIHLILWCPLSFCLQSTENPYSLFSPPSGILTTHFVFPCSLTCLNSPCYDFGSRDTVLGCYPTFQKRLLQTLILQTHIYIFSCQLAHIVMALLAKFLKIFTLFAGIFYWFNCFHQMVFILLVW